MAVNWSHRKVVHIARVRRELRKIFTWLSSLIFRDDESLKKPYGLQHFTPKHLCVVVLDCDDAERCCLSAVRVT